MSAALNGFNRIARHYDLIKKLVFGKAIHQSQIHYLKSVLPGGRLLILGGGTGEILPVLKIMNPACQIWYVDAASEMLKIASARIGDHDKNNIRFIHGTENSVPADLAFDAIITYFFLDLFPDKKVSHICHSLGARLAPDGVWLVCDFVNSDRWWQRVLLGLMYWFFKTTCGIEARALPSWQRQLKATGLKETDARSFYGGFIKGAVYRKKVVS